MASLNNYNISAERVEYIGNDKSETRTNASESKELVELFFENYDVP